MASSARRLFMIKWFSGWQNLQQYYLHRHYIPTHRFIAIYLKGFFPQSGYNNIIMHNTLRVLLHGSYQEEGCQYFRKAWVPSEAYHRSSPPHFPNCQGRPSSGRSSLQPEASCSGSGVWKLHTLGCEAVKCNFNTEKKSLRPKFWNKIQIKTNLLLQSALMKSWTVYYDVKCILACFARVID